MGPFYKQFGAGNAILRAIFTEAVIVAGRNRRAKTPFQARHFIDTMRGLFAWAKEAQFVQSNPAAGIKYPGKKSRAGFPVWTEDEVKAYEARWPLGTRERVWLAVLLYTGLRRGDAVRLGQQHVRNGVATIRTKKSQGIIEVAIPLPPPLLEALQAGPTGDLSFICGARGRPLTKESFGNLFRQTCNAAGVRKSAHGVRKSEQPGQRTIGRPRLSLRPFSDGRAETWRRSTRERLTGAAWRRRPSASS